MPVSLKALAIVAGAPLLLSANNPDPRINSGMPPERFRGQEAAIVLFLDDVTTVCGKAPAGYVKLGCQFERNGVPYIAIPNPCPIGDREVYARIMCHELAHRNGWSGEHEQ